MRISHAIPALHSSPSSGKLSQEKMKQLIQDFKTGQLRVVDVPSPALQPGCVLVRNVFSLVSAGTERSTVTTAQKSLLGKARARPDLVKKVMDSVRREGLASAMKKVQTRLD